MEGVHFFKSHFKMENKGALTRMGCRVKDFSVQLIQNTPAYSVCGSKFNRREEAEARGHDKTSGSRP